MIRSIAVAVTLVLAGGASALADPIEDREYVMKERGAIMRILGPMAQGQVAYDAGQALEALGRLNENAQASTDMERYWPAGSEGGDTAPAAFENMAEFEAQHVTYAQNVAAAFEAAPQDLDAFRAVFGPVASGCGTCHEVYRAN